MDDALRVDHAGIHLPERVRAGKHALHRQREGALAAGHGGEQAGGRVVRPAEEGVLQVRGALVERGGGEEVHGAPRPPVPGHLLHRGLVFSVCDAAGRPDRDVGEPQPAAAGYQPRSAGPCSPWPGPLPLLR